MAWSFQRNKGKKDRANTLKDQRAAAPVADPVAFTEPGYRRGGPFSREPLPTYADTIGSHQDNRTHAYDKITDQQKSLPFGTYPAAGSPPADWIGYELEPYERSIKDEHVLNGDEGHAFGPEIPTQRRMQWALNPYWYKNIVQRPQRAPDGYSFTRKFDQGVLGARRLNGNHFSQAQTATDNHSTALQGMVAPLRRRSTFRLEPIAYGEDTVTLVDSTGFVPAPGTVQTPIVANYGPRSFRLS